MTHDPRHRLAGLACLLCLSFLPACVQQAETGDDVEVAEDELRTTYGDLLETLSEEDLDRWIAARRRVVDGFDRICGDTICGGDFSNLTTVRLACSSSRVRRSMRACTWVLGGSIDRVDSADGAIHTEARTFACPVPVKGTARSFLDALDAAGDDALHATLPGTSASFYDALVECFASVTGTPPPPTTGGDYVAIDELLWETPGAGEAWWQTRRSLDAAFADACGDAFCEGEHPDIAPLRFVCAVERASSHVTRCAWSFALSAHEVDRRGRITTRSETRTCPIATDASVAQLTAALSGDDPLHAALPGGATSIYDALVGCL